jgi:TolA-binding protein
MKKFLFYTVGLFMAVSHLTAQPGLTLPEASQQASVKQRIALTDIEINYHSPLVKGRQIWGEVVPFGEVWRAGANENTTISFSTPVKIEGKDLAAGTYGLHMIPSKNNWTIIFSKDYQAWGSFFYDAKQDALRIEVTPEVSPMQEWLSYRFTDLKESSTKVMMSWEKISAGFLIEVNVAETVLSSMRTELRGLSGFTSEGPWQAAEFSLRNNTNLDEASVWIDKSIAVKPTFANLNTKSKLLALKGNTSESEKVKKQAMEIADEQQLNTYGYQLMAAKKNNDAIDIFRLVVKKYPDSWNAYDSLAEALDNTGDKKGGLANYKIALAKSPPSQKKRIEDIIKKIEKNN